MDGCYDADVMWVIPFPSINCSNSLLTNAGPLSLTHISGIPCVANMHCRILMVDNAIMDGKTSTHLMKAFTSTKNCLPINGPAKSKCSLVQGFSGHVHGCNGASTGAVAWL